MTGWWLLARARRTSSALLVIVTLGLTSRLLGDASIRISENSSFSVPWVVVIPTATAAVVGISSRSAVEMLEAGTARSLPALRLAHLAAILLVAAAVTVWGSSDLTADFGPPAALRNLAGFTGLALVSAAIFGGAMAWALPVAMAAAVLTAGASQGRPHDWAWPIHDNTDSVALLAASALLLIGTATLGAARTREAAGEAT
jgi:hypothetical protein